jgi:hypothetical protein
MMSTITNLYVGLPIGALMGDEAQTTQRSVRDAWCGEHRWTADGTAERLTVENVIVASQPVGAMFDHLLNARGEMTPDKRMLFKSEIGVLGIGMNTVDLLVVKGGAPVDRFIAGETIGVRRMLDLCNADGLYSLAELDDQLRSGTLDTSTALPVWEREVLGLIEKQWGKYFRRFGVVVVVGGGAILLRDGLLRRFNGKSCVPDDPVIATARGLYKYALMKSAKSEGRETAIAFDAGFGSVKVCGARGGLVMQSAVATNGSHAVGKLTGLRASVKPLHVENAQGSFYVGAGAHTAGRPVQNLDFDRLSGSPEMMALFDGAMTKYFGN